MHLRTTFELFRVRRTVELFLASMWRSGALAGNSPSEAFFVEIGRTTMTQDDIDNGRLICQIGIAPVKPAEFVIFRITQHTNIIEMPIYIGKNKIRHYLIF